MTTSCKSQVAHRRSRDAQHSVRAAGSSIFSKSHMSLQNSLASKPSLSAPFASSNKVLRSSTRDLQSPSLSSATFSPHTVPSSSFGGIFSSSSAHFVSSVLQEAMNSTSNTLLYILIMPDAGTKAKGSHSLPFLSKTV